MNTFGELVAIIVGAIVLAFAVQIPLYLLASYRCKASWEGTYETKYELFVGCKVLVNGKWVPAANVREF